MNIIKQKVEEKSHRLRSKWTVTIEHGDVDYNVDYEEVAKVLQEEIDWEVMIDVLVEIGWTKVVLDRPNQMSIRMSEQDAHEIKEWCRNNLQGNYHARASIWLFELAKDASMFILKWS